MEDEGGLGQDGCCGGSEMWSDVEYMLVVALLGFHDG